jgi:anti-sigma regulatory factor (Ser/Thr protein kinase)
VGAVSLPATIDRTVRLLATPASVHAARETAAEAAAACGFDAEDSYDLKLAASEAVANAIEHGRPCKDGCIGMRVHDELGGYLTLCVCDCGSWIARPVDPAEVPDRGRGIAVISVLMDHVELVPNGCGTLIRMRKRLPV